MAATCAACGTENPAENLFCTRCGAPLAAAPAAPPQVAPPPVQPAAAAAPPPPARPSASAAPPPPPAFTPGQSPNLPPPPPGTAPLHRTSRNAVIAVVLVTLLVLGGAALAFAKLHPGSSGATSSRLPVIPGGLPSATPAPTTPPPQTTPTPSAPATPSAPGGGGQTMDTSFASVFVPTGYSVSDQQSDALVLSPGSADGLVIVASDPVPAATSDQQLDQALLTNDQQQFDPSAKFCSTAAPQHVKLTGSGGAITADVIAICMNVTPSSGAAFAAVDGYAAGVAKASDGSLKSVLVNVYSPQSDYQAFASSVPDSLFTKTVFKDAIAP